MKQVRLKGKTPAARQWIAEHGEWYWDRPNMNPDFEIIGRRMLTLSGEEYYPGSAIGEQCGRAVVLSVTWHAPFVGKCTQRVTGDGTRFVEYM